jgi:hypothetical protein
VSQNIETCTPPQQPRLYMLKSLLCNSHAQDLSQLMRCPDNQVSEEACRGIHPHFSNRRCYNIVHLVAGDCK